MKAFELIPNGFMIKIDRNLYAREAVMKALYRFHEKYIISYETESVFINVFFEFKSSTASSIEFIETEAAEIIKELNFQMIRLDTARRTKGIRELLVARSLYASCIEPEREAAENDEDEKI
nr:His-Xaa-Ser system protein HxsD [Synergistaceae bacterium]